MSSDNRTPRLHSFRIACAIASATLCATAIAQVAFSLKPAIEVLDNPVIADSPAYPALAISTLVPAVIGIATTILSAVLVWTIKSGDPFKKGSATCLKVLGILFVVQAATSLYAGSLKTSVSMFGGEGGRRRPRDRFIIRLDLSGSRHRPVHAFPALLVRPRAVPRLRRDCVRKRHARNCSPRQDHGRAKDFLERTCRKDWNHAREPVPY